MARSKKSSLDMDEPVVVQGEEMVEPIAEATAVIEKKAETPAVLEKKEKKFEAETQNKVMEKKNKGVKICVF